ncbi:MAG: DUF4276 family protein [Alphaproteobacteria bacterium]|nr:DUF4276 family protein [Alphaproteobacteria bacterium]
MARSPVLILEGDGDAAAVAELVRTVAGRLERWDVAVRPHPITCCNVPRLDAVGQLERFVTHALNRDGDSVLILLDLDDGCARDVALRWGRRLAAMRPRKKVGLGLFVREFEGWFIGCFDRIVEAYPDYGWSRDGWDEKFKFEDKRGAKEWLSRRMKSGKSYKETRDQVRFLRHLDFDRLRDKSRSYQHFETLLEWLFADERPGQPLVQPLTVETVPA